MSPGSEIEIDRRIRHAMSGDDRTTHHISAKGTAETLGALCRDTEDGSSIVLIGRHVAAVMKMDEHPH
jgi:hypothetical protein